jgi:hypothetical protein
MFSCYIPSLVMNVKLKNVTQSEDTGTSRVKANQCQSSTVAGLYLLYRPCSFQPTRSLPIQLKGLLSHTCHVLHAQRPPTQSYFLEVLEQIKRGNEV